MSRNNFGNMCKRFNFREQTTATLPSNLSVVKCMVVIMRYRHPEDRISSGPWLLYSIARWEAYLSVSVYGVSHPATGLNLVGIEPPEFKFLFEQWAAYVRRIVQFARPVVIEDLREDARMSVEKIFVEDRVVIDERFRQSRQSGGRYLFQRRLICLESDASHVQNDPIFSVHGHGLSLICCFPIVNVQKIIISHSGSEFTRPLTSTPLMTCQQFYSTERIIVN